MWKNDILKHLTNHCSFIELSSTSNRMSYVPPFIALISLSRLSKWKTNIGDRESQTGCDLQICIKLLRWNFTYRSLPIWLKRVCLIEVLMTYIKNGKMKYNFQTTRLSEKQYDTQKMTLTFDNSYTFYKLWIFEERRLIKSTLHYFYTCLLWIKVVTIYFKMTKMNDTTYLVVRYIFLENLIRTILEQLCIILIKTFHLY